MTANGEVALVTGGAKRIGAAIARGLGKAGFTVAIHYRSSANEAAELANEIGRDGGKAAIFQADLAEVAACDALIDEVSAQLGPVRLLVNNASAFEPDSPEAPDWTKWDKHFDIHLKAPVALTSRFAARLPAADDGLVVNVIDQRVWRLNPNFFTYTLSKSALWTATRTMAMAFAPKVRVNAIGPGPTLQNARQDAADFQAQVSGLPLKRGPSPDEIARAVRFLIETPSITGQMLALDGGQHLAWETPDIAGIPE